MNRVICPATEISLRSIHPVSRYLQFVVTTAMIVAGHAWSRGAELPSESTLPGQVRRARTLPAESVLPGQPRDPVSTSTPDAALPAVMLPAENLLPAGIFVAQPAAGGAANADPGPVPLGQPPAGQPWLRMNFDGHTSLIRAIAFTPDGQRICSGGDDKAVQTWSLMEAAAGQRKTWLHERTIRWQGQRGPRGRLYALATNGDLLAMAGHGAMSQQGEILLVDPVTGELKRALSDEQNGHRQVVAALSFAPGAGPRRLASLDLNGVAVLWSEDAATGLWSAKQLTQPDRQTYGAATASKLESARRAVAIAFTDAQQVILPQFVKFQATRSKRDVAVWRLVSVDGATGQVRALAGDTSHYDSVTSIAASADGTKLVSADAYGNLLFHDLQNGGVHKLQQPAAVVALSMNANGTRLAAGAARSPQLDDAALLQIWDISRITSPRVLQERKVTHDVHSVALNADASTIAYSQANAVSVTPAAGGGAGVSLRPPVRPVLRVAFAKERPYYRIAFSHSADASDGWDGTFDLQDVRLGNANAIDLEGWLRSDWWKGTWSIQTQQEGTSLGFYLFEGNQRRAKLPLDAELHGEPTAVCWLPDAKGVPAAVAVGTTGQNNIYVFDLAKSGTSRILRQFRGHEAVVRSLSVSRDLRYLASSADDATIRVWPLQGFRDDIELVRRWGATFAVDNGRLAVETMRPDGPLFFRGVRVGHVLRSLTWFDGQQSQLVNNPEAMLAKLTTAAFDAPIAFDFEQQGVPQEAFDNYPNWHPLASLLVADNREWAYWTPAGYYDASFGGQRLFGWQVNQGLERLPDFFLAEQMRQTLEKPEVMRSLLRIGNADAALQEARLPPPAKPDQLVLDAYRLKPRITILSPAADTATTADRLTLRAAIQVRAGLELAPPKAFANGVVAASRRLISEQVIAGGREFTYEWDLRLPSDPRIQLHVVASTDAEVADFQSIVVQRAALPARRHQNLYVFAAGVNNYQDAQIQRLDYAVDNARSLIDVLQRKTSSLYGSDVTTFLDGRATRSLWRNITADYAETLRQRVSPDDLLIFFLSGHGVRDERTGNYYFVTANARYQDIKAERYEQCLSFADFAAFADVPCRKLVILDTCHSGAVQQPLRQQDLKAALRVLQDDLVFTLTASEGNEEAVEDRQRRLGRFTFRLVEALDGAADVAQHGGNGDGIVSWREAARYVSENVASDSAGDAASQRPTFGPTDLLDFTDVPLTSSLVATGE